MKRKGGKKKKTKQNSIEDGRTMRLQDGLRRYGI